MQSKDLRKRFLKFFADRGHATVPSSSLIPDDKSVLLTTAGMQQFKPYLTGVADPVNDFGGKNVFSIQKCFRTDDIDEVGDFSHLTFFEMVGNFSFGGYFKETAIPLSFEFLTSPEGMGIPSHRIFVTAFEGDDQVPRDNEAIALWQEQFKKAGMDAKIGERIFLYGRKKNWWEAGPGPAGPDAEMFYDLGTPHDSAFGPSCHPNCDCGRFVEIGNDVFVQYRKTEHGAYEPLTQKSIDNGRGFERLVMVAQGKKNIFETDLFQPIIDSLPTAYTDQGVKRIIVDHCRAASFLIGDGVRPSNKDVGYVLRKLLRRAIVHTDVKQRGSLVPNDTLPMGVESDLKKVFEVIIRMYQPAYEEIKKEIIFSVFDEERKKFGIAFRNGLREMKQIDHIDSKTAFKIYESYGLTYELIKDFGGERTKNLNKEGFDEEFKKHQETSRAGATAKFGGHGLYLKTGEVTIRDESEVERVTRLHTATHLLHAALRAVLGPEVRQDGSDITVERTRFDFRFGRKLTPDEIKKTEEWVNDAIRRDLKVEWEEMPYEEALQKGALGFFHEKYPPRVKAYSVFDPATGEVFSRELCGGPHVAHTAEIGQFKIIKEESSSAGVRRIRG
ncbi:MAG: alanine--tRNA ligase, partial [Patescibacteria group bacterium]